MAKSVFGSHAQTAHVWAQGRIGNGRASDGRMYFEGRTLYSYGSHFALGVVILDGGVPVATLINSDSYSPSTGKHQRHTRNAARGRNISVPSLTDIAIHIESVTDENEPMDVRKARAKRFKPMIADHIAKYHARFADEAATSLLGLVGGTPKQALALLEKGRKASAAKDKASAKVELDNQLRRAKAWGNMSRAEFKAAFAEHVGQSTYDAERRAAGFVSDLRKAHKAASAAGKATLKAKMWAQIKYAIELSALADGMSHVQSKNKYPKMWLGIIRRYILEQSAVEPFERDSNYWGNVMGAANGLIGFIKNRPSLGALLNALGNLSVTAERARMERRDHEDAVREAARIEREQEAARAESERKAAWFNNEPNATWRGVTEGQGAYLRAIHVERDASGAIVGGTLQTSRGADVPLTHALRAFRFIKLCHVKGEGWKANGRTIPVGHFRVDSIKPNGDFIAGCHFIEWAQVEALAISLGVADIAPDNSALVSSH